MTRPQGITDRMGLDAVERIRIATRFGRQWTCHLRVAHLVGIVKEAGAWEKLGLDVDRVRASLNRGRGTRLSSAEVHRIAARLPEEWA